MLTSNPGNYPVSVGSTAYDSENVSLAGDYVPSVTARGFYVGTSGNVALITAGGNTTTYYNVPAGQVICQAFTQILAAGTTASQIVAMV
jgi:hypothetical protein